jgi:RNA polymerase sigma-70 factor (ECF subfamily)
LVKQASPDADDRRRRFEAEALPLMSALQRTALRLTRDAQQAGDLVQDTWLRAYRAYDQFAAGTNCRAWLFTILYSVFNTGYRRAQREVEALRMEAMEAAYERWLDDSGVPSAVQMPDEPIDAMDVRVEHALDELPEAFRTAVMLVDVGELSYEEAAAVMNCAVGTVRSRLFRARKCLFAALLPYAREACFVDAGRSA